MKTKKTDSNQGLLKISCPRCRQGFGLDVKVVERYAEVNMRYKCPYCSHEANLK